MDLRNLFSMATLVVWVALVFLPMPAESAGEYCHGRLDSFNTWHRGFQCPEQYDGEEARYCCGTCTLRYCCTSIEARLDQSTCDTDDTTLSTGTNNGKVRALTPNVPTYLPFVIVVSTFLSFVVAGTVVSICCCHCLKPKSAERQHGQTPTQACLLEPGEAQETMTLSKDSSPSSSSAGRSTSTTTRPSGSDVTMTIYGPRGNMYPTLSQHQQKAQHFASTALQMPGQFYQPYLSYNVPPEHTMIASPAFLDSHSGYRQPHGQPYPQAFMHTEPIHAGVSI